MSRNGWRLSPLAALVVLGACTSMPSGPDVLALPGTGKNIEQFRGDDVSCRQYALEQLGGSGAAGASADRSQQRYDFAYVQCMYAKGHRIPVIGRAVKGQ